MDDVEIFVSRYQHITRASLQLGQVIERLERADQFDLAAKFRALETEVDDAAEAAWDPNVDGPADRD
jgi:hypothetical protein